MLCGELEGVLDEVTLFITFVGISYRQRQTSFILLSSRACAVHFVSHQSWISSSPIAREVGCRMRKPDAFL